MATAAGPYGMRPLRRIDGAAWSGSANYRVGAITSGSTVPIFFGDIVVSGSTGAIAPATATSIVAFGVFQGVEYDTATGHVRNNQWVASSTGSNINAWVIVDPMIVWGIQASASVQALDVGANAPITAATSGQTRTGLSGQALDGGSIATTGTGPQILRILGFQRTPFNANTQVYPDLEVQLNHSEFNTTTGV